MRTWVIIKFDSYTNAEENKIKYAIIKYTITPYYDISRQLNRLADNAYSEVKLRRYIFYASICRSFVQIF